MNRKELFRLSRGDVFRAALGKGPSDLPEDTKIRDSIGGLMGRVEGAELVSDQDHGPAPGPVGLVGDQYCATYNFAEEGVTVQVEAVINVKIYGAGPREGREIVYRKIDETLKQRPEPAETREE